MKRSEYRLTRSTLLTILLLLAAQCLYAREGGAGGHGGGGGIIGLILAPFMILYALYKAQQVKKKKLESENIIAQAALEDPIWNENNMQALAKDMFFKMQQAWMERDLTDVKKLISQELYNDYKTQLDVMKSSHEKNMLEGINVTNVSIISSQDYRDDSQDTFTAYIAGKIIDYTINEQTGNVIKNEKQEEESFSDNYQFIRRGNAWILNSIKNDVSLGDIESAVNYKEQ